MIINTTKGPMDTSLLTKSEGQTETDQEITSWVEYRLDNKIVHRSVDIKLKPIKTQSETGGL